MTTRKRLHSEEPELGATALGPSLPKRVHLSEGYTDHVGESAKCGPAPLSSQLPPLTPRHRQITIEEARKGTSEPVRVYADGVFDVFHNGHARALMQAKNAFPNVYLLVGVTSDELTHRLKGRTVMCEKERYDALRHCRYVDEVVEDAPWLITPDFLEKHQIDFVAHDDLPYNCGDAEDIYKPIKEMGKFVATQRTEGVSTSDIIARIVRDYDMYVRRNLDRGYSAKDLNVGFMKEKEVRLREQVSKLRHRMEDKLEAWEEKSKDLMGGFLRLFGRDGRINEFFHDQKEKIKRVFSPLGNANRRLEPGFEDEGASSSGSGSASRSPSHSPRGTAQSED